MWETAQNLKWAVQWSKYDNMNISAGELVANGSVKVWMDNEPIVDWTGPVGRSDVSQPCGRPARSPLPRSGAG